MISRLLPFAIFTAALLLGCQESGTEIAADVNAARDDASERSETARDEANSKIQKANASVTQAQQTYVEGDASAREELTEAESNAMIKTAKADFEVGTVDVDGRYDVAKELCNTATGVDKEACLSTADATRAAEQALVVATRDAALVAADRH